MSLGIKEEIKMSMKKLEKLCGLFLKEGEKRRLHELCIEYGIPITYPKLFEDDNHYYFWGIRKTSIGLISVVIMNYLNDNNGTVFHSIEELEEYLKEEFNN